MYATGHICSFHFNDIKYKCFKTQLAYKGYVYVHMHMLELI